MSASSLPRPSVAVTGAAGFIGSRLAARLIGGGERVIAVDDPRHFETRPEIAAIFRDARPAEILDMEELPARLEKSPAGDISGVIHLGACTDTTEMDEALLERVNTAYTRRLWEGAARRKIPFLYASSAAVYGDGSGGYDDETPPGEFAPLNPYGASKIQFDIWALGEGQRDRPPAWAGFRFFNVYGFGEAHKKKCPVCSTRRSFKSWSAGRSAFSARTKKASPTGIRAGTLFLSRMW